MIKRNAILILTAAFLFGAGIGIIALFWEPIRAGREIKSPPAVGLQAAEFTLTTLSGDTIDQNTLRGQPVVLNFWATWCPPCKEEMPLLDDYARRLAGKAVFLAIDVEEDDEDVQSFVNQSGVTLPIGMDHDGMVAELYYVHSFPVTFFIDSEGIIRAQHIGQLDEKLLVRYLAKIGINP